MIACKPIDYLDDNSYLENLAYRVNAADCTLTIYQNISVVNGTDNAEKNKLSILKKPTEDDIQTYLGMLQQFLEPYKDDTPKPIEDLLIIGVRNFEEGRLLMQLMPNLCHIALMDIEHSQVLGMLRKQ